MKQITTLSGAGAGCRRKATPEAARGRATASRRLIAGAATVIAVSLFAALSAAPPTWAIAPGAVGADDAPHATSTTPAEVVDKASVIPGVAEEDVETDDESAVSENGRYVAFIARVACPDSGDDSHFTFAPATTAGPSSCGHSEAYVRDRQAGTTTLVSRDPDNPDSPIPHDVDDVTISGDGSTLAFDTVDTVFTFNRSSAAVTPVLFPFTGVKGQRPSTRTGLSLDQTGTHIAYTYDTIDADYDDTWHLIVQDWQAGIAGAVDIPLQDDAQQVYSPVLAANPAGVGLRLAYVVGAPSYKLRLEVVDVADSVTPLLDREIEYMPDKFSTMDGGRIFGDRISLSSDGRFVAYPATASYAALSHVAVQDLTSLGSAPQVLANPGAGPNCTEANYDYDSDYCYAMGLPSLSADGNAVAFDTPYSSQSPAGNDDNIFVASPVNAEASPVSVRSDGQVDSTLEGNVSPAITGDGGGVVFYSASSHLTGGGPAIVYVHAFDSTAPAFAAGGALTATDVTASGLELNWPADSDADLIGYRVTQDGVVVADVDSTVTSMAVRGLTAGSTYAFAVRPVDAALNLGEPLTLSVSPSSDIGLPGQAPLVVDAAAGGGHATLRWDRSPDATVTGYRIFRAKGDSDPMTQVDEVDDPTTVTFEDSGLDADTTYRYRISTVDSDNLVRAYTVITSVTTPALSPPEVAVNADFVDGSRAVQLGSHVDIVVRGDANRTASATAMVSTISGVAAKSVPLTQTRADSGIYTGELAVSDGIVSIDSVQVALTDAADHTAGAAATGTPMAVSGALAVTVTAPDGGSVHSAILTVLDAAGDTGAQRTVDSGQTVLLPLATGNDYTLVLAEPSTDLDAPGFEMARQRSIAVTAGKTSSTDVKPTLPAFLSVGIDPDVNAQINVYDADDGGLIGSASAIQAVDAHAFGPLPAGEKLKIATTLFAPQVHAAPRTKTTPWTLAPGENHVAVSYAPLPDATISGTVTLGSAPVFAHVTGTETVDGRTWSFSTDTADDGTYSLAVLAGTVQIAASRWDTTTPPQRTVAVAPKTDMDVDLDLPASRHYQLSLSLTKARPGGAPQTVPVDWQVASRYGVQVSTTNGRVWSGGDLSPALVVPADPGDEVTMCAGGADLGLPRLCHTTALGDSLSVSLGVTLTGAGTISGRLVDADGAAFTQGWDAQIFELVDGARRYVGTTSGMGSALAAPVPEAGDYEIDVTADRHVASPPVDVQVDGTGHADADDIRLAADPAFGSDDEAVTAASDTIVPGQAVQIRVAYRYAVSAAAPTHATLRLGIPAGASLVDNSIVVNGHSVGSSETGGFASVVLPDMLRPGDSGVAHYTVTTRSTTPSGTLVALARMSYGSGGDALLGSASVAVVDLTLAAPEKIKDLAAPVSGQAPAGAIVEVFDRFGQVAQAVASPGGRWSATAQLSDLGELHTYRLYAVATYGVRQLRSNSQYVVHDSHLVLPTTISVHQPDGAVVTFKPSDGVADFQYSFNPEKPVVVSSCFDDPSDVENLSVRIGPFHQDSAPGTRAHFSSSSSAGSGCFNAQLNPGVNELGDVYLDYDAAPTSFTAATMPQSSAAEGPEVLPPQFAGYTNAHVATAGSTASMSLNLNDYGAKLEATASRGDSFRYSPTPSDLAAAKASGTQIYGLNATARLDGDDIDFSVSMIVPTSTVPVAAPHGIRLATHAIAPADNVTEGIEATTLVVGGKLLGGAGALWGALHAGAPYQQLSGLLDQISTCQDPNIVANDTRYLQNVADKIAALQAAKAAAFAFGFLGGWASFGVTAALGALTALGIDLKVDSELSDATDRIATDAASPACHKKPKKKKPTKDPQEPVATPVWVIDPSGYAYEAIGSNRLSGVTATLLVSSSSSGPFTVWDASGYGQTNPQLTAGDGLYGWDVPPGSFWKIAYSKAGYYTTYSTVFSVPPPRFDVNTGLVRITPPRVTLARATGGPSSSVTIVFDDFMAVDSVTGRITVLDADGHRVAGVVSAIDSQRAPDGAVLAKGFRFTPHADFDRGASLTVTVDPLVHDYASHTLDSLYSVGVTAAAPTSPGEPTAARAYALTGTSLMATWAAPIDDGGAPVTGYVVTASPGAHSVAVPVDTHSATLAGLSALTDYTVSIVAVNAVGSGDAADVEMSTPPSGPGGRDQTAGGSASAGDTTPTADDTAGSPEPGAPSPAAGSASPHSTDPGPSATPPGAQSAGAATAGTVASSSTLAATGIDSELLVGYGIAAILSGFVLILGGRRRSATNVAEASHARRHA